MTGQSIGAVARATGVKVPTIRFYEGIGLLPPPRRSDGNRRSYDGDAIRRLNFIRHARELGFDMEAVRQLLRLADQPEQPCEDADAIARQRLVEIDSKIARLQLLRDEIQHMVDECTQGRVCDCRVIGVLAEQGHLHAPPARGE